MDRRNFISTAAVASTVAVPSLMATNAIAQTRPKAPQFKVVIIGGGMAGATCAKYLRLWGGGNVAVTIVERNTAYVSNILSSLVLTGQKSLTSLTYDYNTLHSAYGITVVKGDVKELSVHGSVVLTNGEVISGDKIVIAAGVEFDAVPGLTNPLIMPHAWQAGPQTTELANQLKSMPDGKNIVITIPLAPFRCPPGPYERACLLASWAKVNKPKSKVIVLDANPSILVEVDNFTKAFAMHGIQYVPNASIVKVNSVTKDLETTMGVFTNNGVVNLIPAQRAANIVKVAGLNNATKLPGDSTFRFAGVDNLTYASTVSGAGKVHIIGDSSATPMPKAGHVANQQAKVCADAIIRSFLKQAPDQAPVTNSACFSTITMTEASWLSAVYQYNPATKLMQVSPSVQASEGWSKDDFEDMNKWFSTLMTETFK